MAVAFRSIASTTYASRTNTTVSAPAGLANDDILLAGIFVGSSSTTVPTVTPPAGFAALTDPTNSTNDGSFYGKLRIFWKRAVSESGSYTFTHTTASSQCILFAISGAHTSSPVDVSSFNAVNVGGSAPTTATGVTTTDPDDLLTYIAHDWTASGALSPPTGFTERFDGLVYGATKLLTVAGATGNVTQNNGNPGGSGPWSAWLIAIKPAGSPNVNVNVTGVSATGSVGQAIAVLPGAPTLMTSSVSSYGGTDDVVFSAPSGLVDNDIIICSIFSFSTGSLATMTPPTGFTELSVSPINVTDASSNLGRHQVWWKRAASESGSYTFTSTPSTNSRQSSIITVRDCITTGSPVDANSANSANFGQTTTATGITTTVAYDLLLWLSHDWTGGGSLSPPTGFTERYDSLLYAADKAQTASGATGNFTQSNANPPTGNPWSAFLVALKPIPPATGGVTASPSGVAATGSVGQVSVTTAAIVSTTGVAGTGAVGQATVTAKANVSATGVSGTGAVGQVGVAIVTGAAATGVAATGSVGQVTVSAKANVTTTGVAATGAVGQVTVVGKAVVSVTGVAAQGSVGQLTVASGATLNPADKKNGLLTLSNGNLTATSTDSGGNNWVRSTTSQTGKRYVEFKVDTYAASHAFGISDLSAITYVGADAHSFGLYGNGFGGINGTFPDWGGGAGTPYNTFTTGDTVCMAVDLTAKKVWWKINAGGWNGGFGDPVAGTGGNDISAYTGTPHYIIVSGGLNFVSTVNFGATAFTYTPPSGYSSWNGVTNVSTTLTGVAATGAVGQVTVTAKQFVTVIPTGVAGTGAVGQVGVSAGLKVIPTGVAATGAVGQVTVGLGTGITASATGVFATGFVGQVTVTSKQFVSITAAGVQGTGFVGQASVSLPIGGLKNVKVWNGSAWVAKPVKVWSGSTWVQKSWKRWNGSAWV